MSDIRQPRAPRRHQSEVDAARQEKNKLRDELRDVRSKNERLRTEIRNLHRAFDQCDVKLLREDRDRLRAALSFIGHSPSAGDDAEHLKAVARIALGTSSEPRANIASTPPQNQTPERRTDG